MKDYELTPKEADDVWVDNRRVQSHISYDIAIAHAAQKKLAVYIHSKAKYTRYTTGESFYAISEFDMHELLRDFGL